MLRVAGLRVAYGARTVLHGIDLVVAPGEIVGLVGPNGSGKTTLLKAITAAVPVQEGAASLEGVSLAGLDARERARRVAIVPQNPTLPVGFTARDVVVMGRTPHLGFFDQEGAADLRKAEHALGLTGALHLADRRVDELSGGERQRVVIARALAQESPVLLLDEPTANLDIGHQIAVAKLLRCLAPEKALCVLAALHDLTLASLHCDRLALMQEGRILADGPPAAVLTAANLQQAYGAATRILHPDDLPGPVVLPLE